MLWFIAKFLIKNATMTTQTKTLKLRYKDLTILGDHIGPKTVINLMCMQEVSQLFDMRPEIKVLLFNFPIMFSLQWGLTLIEQCLVEVKGDQNILELPHP